MVAIVVAAFFTVIVPALTYVGGPPLLVPASAIGAKQHAPDVVPAHAPAVPASGAAKKPPLIS
jgi:hypothetical protein